jgi:MFS family permease
MPTSAVTSNGALNPESDQVATGRPFGTLDRWAVAALVAGNTLEFFDFLAYATFAVYIGRAFFPSDNAFVSLLLSLATFGVGFFMRPLAAVLIGAYADRAGRRPALLLSISLMAIGTLALAVTPSYATIGLAAPVILVIARIVQGIGLGGEVGPSTAALLECARPGRRGFLTSWQGASQGMAVLAAGLSGFVLATILSKQQLADWGWRIPFALGLLIVPVGLYIRRQLPETLEGPGSRGGADVLRVLWRQHRRSLVISLLVIMCGTVSFFICVYMTTYALTTLGMPASQAMLGTLVSGAVMAAGAVWSGLLSDRYGRKPVMIVSRVLLMIAIYPALWFLVDARTAWALVSVTALLTLLTTLSIWPSLTWVTELFPNAVRSSGLSIPYALSVSVFGGTAQYVFAWLIGSTGDPLSPAYYVILTSAIGLWAMFQLPETFAR